jgi:hypothetical protein
VEANISPFRFMLYHLFQTAISKDVTLHVSANNNAMVFFFLFFFYKITLNDKRMLKKKKTLIDFIPKIRIQA